MAARSPTLEVVEETVCARARPVGEDAELDAWGMKGGTRMEVRDRRFLAMLGSEAAGEEEVRERRCWWRAGVKGEGSRESEREEEDGD